MSLVPAALAVHWKVTLLTVLPLPSALFQLPPALSVTVNELNSPVPTVVRSVWPAGLAQPLVTVIAGPAAAAGAAGLSNGMGSLSLVGAGARGAGAGAGRVSAVGAGGAVSVASSAFVSAGPCAPRADSATRACQCTGILLKS